MQYDVSVIIPSRNDEYLNKTVNDLLKKSDTNIEVIIVLDGYWSNEIIENNKVRYIHHGTVHDSFGMRESINAGIRISSGKYIIKVDEHVMFDQGFDRKLIESCEDNYVVIPRRKRLEPDTWTLIEDGRPPIDYMFLDYPYKTKGDITDGLHGAEWRDKHYERKDVMIDDLMTMQGSCYFMKRSWWDFIGEMDSDLYGNFTQEAQEIGNKTWLGGGRMIVNKNTWYAHYHKGKRGKGYGFSTDQYKAFCRDKEKGRLACIDYWVNNRWEKRVHDFEWLIDKFMPLPNWPLDWKTKIMEDAKFDFSQVGKKGFWLQP